MRRVYALRSLFAAAETQQHKEVRPEPSSHSDLSDADLLVMLPTALAGVRAGFSPVEVLNRTFDARARLAVAATLDASYASDPAPSVLFLHPDCRLSLCLAWRLVHPTSFGLCDHRCPMFRPTSAGSFRSALAARSLNA